MNYYITGDLHGELRLLFYNMPLTSNDTLIILGDFGCIWYNDLGKQKAIISMFQFLPYTVAFIDGNHENFPMIERLEKYEKWNGGTVGKIAPNLIHLLRGEVYNLNGKLVGVCGGADSVDRSYRTEGVSWWKEEEITSKDIDRFFSNYDPNTKLDFILTHDCPASLVPAVKLYSGINSINKISNSQKQLERINSKVDFNKWYFGHWHIDKEINEKFECLYKGFKKII